MILPNLYPNPNFNPNLSLTWTLRGGAESPRHGRCHSPRRGAHACILRLPITIRGAHTFQLRQSLCHSRPRLGLVGFEPCCNRCWSQCWGHAMPCGGRPSISCWGHPCHVMLGAPMSCHVGGIHATPCWGHPWHAGGAHPCHAGGTHGMLDSGPPCIRPWAQ